MKVEKVAILYVEGDSDLIFYKRLFQFIREINGKRDSKVEFINIKGVGKFASKVPAKYKNEIVTKYPHCEHNIFLAYDTDVFDLGQKPPIDWNIIEEKLKLIGSPFIFHLKAEKMIEDWFINDLEGICSNLKIDIPRKIKGHTGYEKLQGLFKSANRIYQKGYNSNSFIESLNLNVIFPKIEKLINPLIEKLY